MCNGFQEAFVHVWQMHKGLAQVCQLVFIHPALSSNEIPWCCPHHGILHKGGFQQVNFCLRRLTNVDVAIAARTALDGVQGIKHIGVFAMVIQPSFCHLRLVLRGVKYRVPDIFAVLQRIFPVHPLSVVHFYYGKLVFRAYRIIIQKLRRHKPIAFQLAFQLRVLLHQHLLVPQFRVEKKPALLDVRHPRLPVDVQQVHIFNRNVTQAVQLIFRPHDFVNPGAGFQLLPHGIGIGSFKLVLFQHTWNDVAQHLRFLPVSPLPWEDIRFRVAFHGIRVFRHDDVVQPAGG